MNKITFKDYGLDIELVPFTNVIGSMSSGKTYLLRMLINQGTDGLVFIDDKEINLYDIDFLKRNVSAVLNNFIFNTHNVKDELMYYQNLLGFDSKKVNGNIKRFITFFELDGIINKSIGELSIEDKAFIKILSLLIICPRVLGIDDMLTYLSLDKKLKIAKFSKENKVSIINVTSNSEELLLGSKVAILDNFKCVLYDDVVNVLKNDKVLGKIGMNLPFVANLSNNLNYYDLLGDKYYDVNSLVGELWK